MDKLPAVKKKITLHKFSIKNGEKVLESEEVIDQEIPHSSDAPEVKIFHSTNIHRTFQSSPEIKMSQSSDSHGVKTSSSSNIPEVKISKTSDGNVVKIVKSFETSEAKTSQMPDSHDVKIFHSSDIPAIKTHQTSNVQKIKIFHSSDNPEIIISHSESSPEIKKSQSSVIHKAELFQSSNIPEAKIVKSFETSQIKMFQMPTHQTSNVHKGKAFHSSDNPEIIISHSESSPEIKKSLSSVHEAKLVQSSDIPEAKIVKSFETTEIKTFQVPDSQELKIFQSSDIPTVKTYQTSDVHKEKASHSSVSPEIKIFHSESSPETKKSQSSVIHESKLFQSSDIPEGKMSQSSDIHKSDQGIHAIEKESHLSGTIKTYQQETERSDKTSQSSDINEKSSEDSQPETNSSFFSCRKKKKDKIQKDQYPDKEIMHHSHHNFANEEPKDADESVKPKKSGTFTPMDSKATTSEEYREMDERSPLLTGSEHGVKYSPSFKKQEDLKQMTSSKSSGQSFFQKMSTFLHLSKDVVTEVKAWVLFGLLALCYIIFIVKPQGLPRTHFISVSNYSPFSTNFSSSGLPSFLFIKTGGAFLPFDANNNTENISFFVSSAEHSDQLVSKIYTIPISNKESIYTAPIVETYIEMEVSANNISQHHQFNVLSSTSYPVPLSLKFTILTRYLYSQVVLGFFIFLCFYLFIIFDLLHRTLATLAATLGVFTILSFLNERFSLQQTLEWVDAQSLILVLGMMIMVSVISDTGVFEYLAAFIFKFGKEKIWLVTTLLSLLSGLLSAFFDNVTAILLLAPITFRLCEMANLNPKTMLMIEVIFSNIGGAATAVGDYPNVILMLNDSFNQKINVLNFTLHMFVGTLFVFLVIYLVLYTKYKTQENWLKAGQEKTTEMKHELSIWQNISNSLVCYTQGEDSVNSLLQQKIGGLNVLIEKQALINRSLEGPSQPQETPVYTVTKPWLLVKSSIILFITLVMYFIMDTHFFGTSLGWFAIFGAILLLILADIRDIASLLHRIDWATIIFLGGFYILIKAVGRLGVFHFIGDTSETIIQQAPPNFRLVVAIVVILWVTSLFSMFFNNLPFTIMMIPIIIQISNNDSQNLPLLPLIITLAFGACLGGNGSLFGAMANILAAGIAEQHGYQITFKEFFKLGFPTTLLSTFIVMIYLLICHGLLEWN